MKNRKKRSSILRIRPIKVPKRIMSFASVAAVSLAAMATVCPLEANAIDSVFNDDDTVALSSISTYADSVTDLFSELYEDVQSFCDENIETSESEYTYNFNYYHDDSALSIVCVKYSRTMKYSSPTNTISTMEVPSDIEFDENGLPTNYSYIVTGKASAYCTGTTTATGTTVHSGTVAVKTSLIPYGSRLYIVTSDGSVYYGYGVAEDTGAFAWNGSGRVADLYMTSYIDCINWGVRYVTIYVF